ncbi:MAG: sensor histidine kinase [Pyrinomonadaceae bacterium]|nr:sensor histidine kinase [Sphingobacteriaceae bacterium]
MIIRLSLFVLLIPSMLFAQSKEVDSLYKTISRTKLDTVRINSLNALSIELAEDDSVKAVNLANQAIKNAIKVSYWKGLAKAYYALGNVYDLHFDYPKASQYYKQAISISAEQKILPVLGESYQALGLVEKLQAKYREALGYNLKALTIYRTVRDSAKIGRVCMNIGNTYKNLLLYKQAISYHIMALRIFEKLGSKRNQIKAYNNIGVVYESNSSFESALINFKKALVLAEQIEDKELIASSYQNIGAIYSNTGRHKEALSYFKKAYAINIKIHQRLSQSIGLSNIAECYAELHRADSCLYYSGKGLIISREIKDNEGIAYCYLYSGMAYMDQGQYPKAKEALSAGMETVNDFDLVFVKSLYSEQYSSLFYKMGDYKKAYDYQTAFKMATDSIRSDEKSKQISEIQTKYETEKKEQQISLLNKENTIQKLSISRRNLTILIIVFAFLITALLGGLLYNRYRLKQESLLQGEIMKQQDLATKAVIEAEENERRRIAGELHDGLGQMFSTVKLNLSGMESSIAFNDEYSRQSYSKTLLLIDESCKEVRSISHQMAPNVLLKSGLVSAIRDFINHVDERQIKINLNVSGLNERLDSNVEAVVYRVIQEAVNNVIKHAKASHLDIQLIRDEEGLSAMVEDDGVGFVNSEQKSGMGLRNIITRITYLKGTVDFDSSEGKGTVISVWVPLG